MERKPMRPAKTTAGTQDAELAIAKAESGEEEERVYAAPATGSTSVKMHRRVKCELQTKCRWCLKVLLSVLCGLQRAREKMFAFVKGTASKAPIARDRVARPTC